jgi:hypothetical protein
MKPFDKEEKQLFLGLIIILILNAIGFYHLFIN